MRAWQAQGTHSPGQEGGGNNGRQTSYREFAQWGSFEGVWVGEPYNQLHFQDNNQKNEVKDEIEGLQEIGSRKTMQEADGSPRSIASVEGKRRWKHAGSYTLIFAIFQCWVFLCSQLLYIFFTFCLGFLSFYKDNRMERKTISSILTSASQAELNHLRQKSPCVTAAVITYSSGAAAVTDSTW